MRYSDTASVVNVASGSSRARVCTRTFEPLYTCAIRQRHCAIAPSLVGDRLWEAAPWRALPGGRAMLRLSHPAAVDQQCLMGRCGSRHAYPTLGQPSEN